MGNGVDIAVDLGDDLVHRYLVACAVAGGADVVDLTGQVGAEQPSPLNSRNRRTTSGKTRILDIAGAEEQLGIEGDGVVVVEQRVEWRRCPGR